VQRGEVWWTDFPEPVGRRPALLISRNETYTMRTSLTVAAITTRIRDIPSEVKLGAVDSMPRDCTVNMDAIHTLTTARLIRRMTVLSESKMQEVNKAIIFALGLGE
jgi:mRNA interferase MazF